MLNRPWLLRGAARLMWNLGCGGFLAGVLAAALTAILSVVTTFTGATDASYQQLFPGVPTWWVPESVAGFGVYLTAMLWAYLLHDFARELERLRRA